MGRYDYSGLGLMQIDPLLMIRNDFHIFVPSDLDLWPLDSAVDPLVTLVQRYVFTKLEVSTAFLFRENRRNGTDGRTDRQTDEVLRVPYGEPHNNIQHKTGAVPNGRLIGC